MIIILMNVQSLRKSSDIWREAIQRLKLPESLAATETLCWTYWKQLGWKWDKSTLTCLMRSSKNKLRSTTQHIRSVVNSFINHRASDCFLVLCTQCSMARQIDASIFKRMGQSKKKKEERMKFDKNMIFNDMKLNPMHCLSFGQHCWQCFHSLWCSLSFGMHQPGAYSLIIMRHLKKKCVNGAGGSTIWGSVTMISQLQLLKCGYTICTIYNTVYVFTYFYLEAYDNNYLL